MDVVVIGAGFAGACTAWLLRERGDVKVTILEQSSQVGGMLRTYETAEGVRYEYGPRVVSVFRGTPDIFPFLRQFVSLEERDIYQGTRLLPDYPVVPFPVDLESLSKLPCGEQMRRELAEIQESGRPPLDGNLREYLESSVGPTLTELAFGGFNRKFWGRRLEEMPADWGRLRRLERIAPTGDFRLPSEAPHYYPAGGFNPLFEQLLDGLDLRVDTRALSLETLGDRLRVVFDGGSLDADLVVGTAPIDGLLGHTYGALEWRGYRINPRVHEADEPALGVAPDGVPFAWLYTPWAETPICRTTDFGVIHDGPRRSGPRVVLEEVVDDRVSMYPVWWEDERFYRYLDEAAGIPGFVPIGRLGLYKYVTMDSTLAMAQRFLESLDEYLAAPRARRYELLRYIRGDWTN